MKRRAASFFLFLFFVTPASPLLFFSWLALPPFISGQETVEKKATSASSALNSNESAQQERDSFVREYRVGPKDLFEIKVFELPDLNQTVRVSEDGSISLPLLGKVDVQGLTKDALEQKLARLLEERYLQNARVSVFIKEYQSQQVAVIGAVENPGTYELIGRTTLLEMVSRAGGFKDNASNEIYIIREGKDGLMACLVINLEELLTEGNQTMNIPLQPKDIINVPVDRVINVYVFGQVRNPGALQVKMSKKISFLQAIARAGGLTENASKSGIIIKRKDPKTGKELQIKVNIKDIIKGKKPDPASPEFRRGVVNSFLGAVKVSPLRMTRLVEVSFTHHDPRFAAAAVNALFDSFIDLNIETKYQATEQASAFLNEQIASLRQEIEKKETELQKYGQEKNIVLLSDKETTTVDKLAELNRALTEAQIGPGKKRNLLSRGAGRHP